MAAVEPAPAPDGTLDAIRAARADLDRASVRAALTHDPIAHMLAASAAGLGAFEVAIRAMSCPMDADLRDRIVAVYDRQAKAERQDRLTLARMSTWRDRRNAVLACAGAVAVLLGTGAGLFAAGWSYGGTARLSELCRGEAVREQDGGRTCAFWLVQPVRKAGR